VPTGVRNNIIKETVKYKCDVSPSSARFDSTVVDEDYMSLSLQIRLSLSTGLNI